MQPADHPAYLRQLGRFAYADRAPFAPLLAELCADDLAQVATEIRNERIVRDAHYQSVELVLNELSAWLKHTTGGDKSPQD